MTDQAKDTIFGIMEKWGFPTLAALGLAYFIRADLIQPLLEEHRLTLKEVRETQREIADTMSEQTRLLYAIQGKVGDKFTSTAEPDTTAN